MFREESEMNEKEELNQKDEDKSRISYLQTKKLGKLLRPRRSHPKTSDTQYIEILECLNEAIVNLENAKDSIRNRINEFRGIREYLSNELITDELEKLNIIKHRLEGLKEMIEEMEEIIIDLQS
jgi:hypothetical protein